MTIKILEVKNPRYIDESAVNIDVDLVITISGGSPETVTFTASPSDLADHGRLIHQRAINEEYGIIADYVAPPEPEEE